jgi:hypothetical protein
VTVLELAGEPARLQAEVQDLSRRAMRRWTANCCESACRTRQQVRRCWIWVSGQVNLRRN